MTLVGSVTDNGIGTITIGGITPTSGIITYRNPGSIFDQTLSYSGGAHDIPFLPDGHYVMTVDGADGHIATVTFDAVSGNLSGPPIIVNGATTMATGSGREYTATQRAHTVGQRYFDIKGNGPSEDTAIIELGRKVTLIHGSVVLLGRPRISVVMADADFDGDTGALGAGGYAARVAARDSAGEQENVQITLEQTFDAGTIDERVETSTVRIPACSDSIKLAGTAVNDIDPANAKVTAFVTAYYDGDGNNGYQFRSGKFVR